MVLVIFCWWCEYFWICYWFLFLCFYFSCFILWHWYHLLLIVDLWFSYFIWIGFLSATFTVFNVVFRGQYFCVRLFVVYNFCWNFWLLCFHICSIILFLFFLIHYYIYDIFVFTDFFGFNVILMVECFHDWWFYVCHWCFWFICFCFCHWYCRFSFYHLVFKNITKLFCFHFFIFNQDYLTVFYMTFVLVTAIYLVWYVFGCLIIFPLKISFSLDTLFY